MKLFLPLVLIFCFSAVFGQQENFKDIKWRKMDYSSFSDRFAINDTATVVIDIFFDKRENAATGQMTFLPITAALAAIPQTRVIGLATSMISFPIFLHGGYTLVKYRKRKLYKVLDHYKGTKELPTWLMKKVDKQLTMYKVMERDY